MSTDELKENIDSLFSEYEKVSTFSMMKAFKINNLTLFIHLDLLLFTLLNRDNTTTIYSSTKDRDDEYEEFFDELIIFKELILPKYL